jgi:hypothetical protein
MDEGLSARSSKMNCGRCGASIPDGEEMEYYGQVLCEDCYMQAFSPAQACDPWAVRSAQILSQIDDDYAELTELQSKILQVLKETGGASSEMIAQEVELSLSALERELATLRHMEEIRGQMRDGQKIICLW